MLYWTHMKWKPVVGFETVYEVSRLGEVRRKGSSENRKKQLTHKGYFKVFLYDGDTKRAEFVHRIVARAWIPNPDQKPNINHKNGIKTDNRAKNLEWCTTLENNGHAKELKLYKPLRGSEHGNAALTEEIVLEMRRLRSQGYTYQSIAELYSVDTNTARRAINKMTWKHI